MALEYIDFEGTFRRLIDLKAWDSNTVVGWLEDDYHHFGITLTHDGSVITGVRVAEPRHPWTACPGADGPLNELVGKPLFGRCSDIGKALDMRRQCTHLFDLAGLVVAHASHRRDHHRYHATLQRLDAVEPGAPAALLRGSLRRDDLPVMEWDVNDRTIVHPASAAGRSIDHGFREWTETMDEAEAEYAYIMRRAIFVGLGRKIRETEAHIADTMPMGPVCHNYQPEQRMTSVRILENIRRFNDSPAAMLSKVNTKP